MKKDVLNIDMFNQVEIDNWCNVFNCSESTLRNCVRYVGCSIISLESFYSKNINWIEERMDIN